MLTLLCAPSLPPLPLLPQDFYQLLSPTVSVLRGGGPYGELYTLADFTQQEQLSDPRLWIDIKALMGDSSDNVPGVKVRPGG
jgi:5'-3' exonuclease